MLKKKKLCPFKDHLKIITILLRLNGWQMNYSISIQRMHLFSNFSLKVSFISLLSNILGLRWRIVLTKFWLASTSQTVSTLGLLFWMESGTTLRVPIRHFWWEYFHTFTTLSTGNYILLSFRKSWLPCILLYFDCEKSRSKCCKTHISEHLCTLIKTVEMVLKSI